MSTGGTSASPLTFGGAGTINPSMSATFGGTTGAFGFGATPTTSTPTSTVPTFSFDSTSTAAPSTQSASFSFESTIAAATITQRRFHPIFHLVTS
jgi:hypothetical protein